MRALAFLLAVPVLMWGVQSALLWRAGLPIRWRLSAAELPAKLKRANRVATYVLFGVVLLGWPLLEGTNPALYYFRFLPCDARAAAVAWGAAASVLYLALLYLAWLLSGNVRFEKRHSTRRLVQRLAGVPLTAVLVTLVEELLFRGVLLYDLLQTLPAVAALVIGTLVFAAAHYVRSVKRYWTFPGHVALGALLCVAFYATGDIWLSGGLHAGGVLVLMGVRPFVRYEGPPWLVGASIFPYAGVVGVAALVLLTVNVWLRYGSVG